MKLISFVVPCYNSAGYMKKCIDSLLCAGEDAEIIIIDDGSTDGTGAIAESYAAAHPSCVRVHHQENGGHGAGIMSGLSLAEGRYFKVVDSDDWLDRGALAQLLARLRTLKEAPDLVVCNYVYWRADEGRVKTIRYANALPAGRVIGWEETGRFGMTQYLTIHSCIFRTKVLRECGLDLPRHIFYEDNLYVCQGITRTDRMLYLDLDLYMYYVGREGQSVSRENLIRRGSHQAEVSVRIFESVDLARQLRICPKRGRYLYHATAFFMTIATVFVRMSQTEEADEIARRMWERAFAKDPVMARRVRRSVLNRAANLPGRAGRKVCCGGYQLAHRVVRFN